jgi:hypothetical protein
MHCPGCREDKPDAAFFKEGRRMRSCQQCRRAYVRKVREVLSRDELERWKYLRSKLCPSKAETAEFMELGTRLMDAGLLGP